MSRSFAPHAGQGFICEVCEVVEEAFRFIGSSEPGFDALRARNGSASIQQADADKLAQCILEIGGIP